MYHNYFPSVVKLNLQDLCGTSTKVTSKGFIASDRFPLSISGKQDCSCVLQPQLPTPAGIPVTVSVMYARLPEPQRGSEELWIEDKARLADIDWPYKTFKQLGIVLIAQLFISTSHHHYP